MTEKDIISVEQCTHFIAQHGVMKLKITECGCAIFSLTCFELLWELGQTCETDLVHVRVTEQL